VTHIQEKIDTVSELLERLLVDSLAKSMDQEDLLDGTVRLAQLTYRVKGRIKCQHVDLYALECEQSLPGYNGLCPLCNDTHVHLSSNKGFYIRADDLHRRVVCLH
jgi:Zn finger protein HypA/HybF involved in hydrogenase expression